jgi:hypothetical protein
MKKIAKSTFRAILKHLKPCPGVKDVIETLCIYVEQSNVSFNNYLMNN